MKNLTTKPYPEHLSLQALREEAKKARLAKEAAEAVTVNIEDAIFTRIIEAEELLTVAVGLFTELAENKNNWLFNYQSEIVDARWVLHNIVHDRPRQ